MDADGYLFVGNGCSWDDEPDGQYEARDAATETAHQAALSGAVSYRHSVQTRQQLPQQPAQRREPTSDLDHDERNEFSGSTFLNLDCGEPKSILAMWYRFYHHAEIDKSFFTWATTIQVPNDSDEEAPTTTAAAAATTKDADVATADSQAGICYDPQTLFRHIPIKKKFDSNPKSMLAEMYNSLPERTQITNGRNYINWHDDGPSHGRKHSAVFVCPLTHECFAAVRFGDSEMYDVDTKTGTVWFRTIKMASQAAAYHAIHSHVLRRSETTTSTIEAGSEENADDNERDNDGAPIDDADAALAMVIDREVTTKYLDPDTKTELPQHVKSIIQNRIDEWRANDQRRPLRNAKGKAIQPHYTSLFVCPVSHEVFACGRYVDPDHADAYVVDAATGAVCYRSKRSAEHAVAARALACLVYRTQLQLDPSCDTVRRKFDCLDDPYTKDQGPEQTPSPPKNIQVEISNQILAWKAAQMDLSQKQGEEKAYAEDWFNDREAGRQMGKM